MRIQHMKHTGAIEGFSLIELLIVIVIVGILAQIAFPSYNTYVFRSRRTEAKTTLLKAQAAFEQFYAQSNTYVGAPPTIAANLPNTTYYSYATSGVSANAYTITATAIGSQLTGDTNCKSLTINNTGSQTSLNNLNAISINCWSQ